MSDDIFLTRRGAAGLITLNRPKALNALTGDMLRAIGSQLDAWAADEAITRVVVKANGDRAFSAGGDIRHMRDLITSGRQEEGRDFFRDEYRINAKVKHFPKPYVSLIDGIVMGGGVGISAHGSHRVAGDRFNFAMPEVGIGFFPDVGGTWLLSHMPGEIGTFCALTGERLGAADGLAAGVATHRVASDRFAELADALTGNVFVDAVLAAFAQRTAEVTPVTSRRAAIDRIFSATTVEEIFAGLEAEEGEREWAQRVASTMRSKSPTSLKIALRQMRLGRTLEFDECMRLEFRIVSRVLYKPDFAEGVRAVIVDKDNAPKWQPASLQAVSEADIDHYFAPLPGDELVLP